VDKINGGLVEHVFAKLHLQLELMVLALIHVKQIKHTMVFNVFVLLDFSTFREYALHAHLAKFTTIIQNHVKLIVDPTQY
jgi:hypothetical protein